MNKCILATSWSSSSWCWMRGSFGKQQNATSLKRFGHTLLFLARKHTKQPSGGSNGAYSRTHNAERMNKTNPFKSKTTTTTMEQKTNKLSDWFYPVSAVAEEISYSTPRLISPMHVNVVADSESESEWIVHTGVMCDCDKLCTRAVCIPIRLITLNPATLWGIFQTIQHNSIGTSGK